MTQRLVRWASCFIVLVISFNSGGVALADSDQDDIDAGKAAVQQRDCANAVDFLEKVSATMRDDLEWLLLVAKAHDCQGDNAEALKYYKQMNEKKTNQPDVRAEIGRLTLAIKKQQDLRDQEKKKKDESEARRLNLTGKWLVNAVVGFFVRVTEDNGDVRAVFD